MGNSILVTGGAGFIGSSLVRKLLERGYKVIVLDNLVNSTRDNLPENTALTFVEGDITKKSDVERTLLLRPKYVVHLAAHHFIPFCNAHPAETVRVNVFGTQNLLDAVSRSGSVGKWLFASTAAVYAPDIEQCQEQDKLEPIDIYGLTKKCGEEMINLFHRIYNIPCINARIFNAIGPRETNPHLLPEIMDQLRGGASRIILGNLTPKRDYIYVDDISDGIICLLESDESCGSFNVGTGCAYSPIEIIDRIRNITNRDFTVTSAVDKQRNIDRPCLRADNTALCRLGWKGKNNIDDSIRKTLAYYGIA